MIMVCQIRPMSVWRLRRLAIKSLIGMARITRLFRH
jgi:hypothetical protein